MSGAKVSNNAIRDILFSVGPMTGREVADFFPGSSYWNVASALSSMRKRFAKKQVYILKWEREHIEHRDYLRAIYALGDLPDARKPRAVTNSEKCRRWRNRQVIPKINSVWSLANEVSALRFDNQSKSAGIKTP